jgi:hypothetical protein
VRLQRWSAQRGGAVSGNSMLASNAGSFTSASSMRRTSSKPRTAFSAW